MFIIFHPKRNTVRPYMANPAFSFLFLLFLFGKAQTRILKNDSSDSKLVSDGLHNFEKQSPFLSLTGFFSSSESCEHFYGFFPCADNIGGYLFQIAVYEYLLASGEKFLANGSKQLFNILGTGFFGDVFEILMVLPEILVVLISGLTEQKEEAQSRVAVAVGMYAGSTVFCLTLQWGICVIFGRRGLIKENSTPLPEPTISKTLLIKEKLSLLTDTGITTDKRTSYSAGIMLLSLIPFIILQLSSILDTSTGNRIVILIALIISVLGLISYFIYQIYNPWIQERSLEYAKYENLLAGFLQHVQRHAKGKLVTNEGAPNIPIIRSLFSQIDKDGDQTVSVPELEALIRDIKSGKVNVEEEYAIAEVLKAFDVNKDGTITEDEFIEGCKKWINEAKQLADDEGSHSRRSLHKVVQQPWIEKRRHELVKIDRLMSRILKHVQHEAFEAGGFLTDDGRANVDRIKSLFQRFDSNNNKVISESELKEVIQSIKFGKLHLDDDLVVENVMKDLDEDGDHMISEQEFVNGITRWLHKATRVASTKDKTKLIDEFDKIAWKEVESLVFELNENRNNTIHKLVSWTCIKSILLIILGVAIVSFLAEPLVYSILDLSVALRLPTFYIAFVIIPFALKIKPALSAIFPASQKSLRTASLTFSEIYGGVVMNNITGLSIILSIVYIKGLTWTYSDEVLVVLVVCAVIGFLAFFRSSYPLWTCILAFLLYPLTLLSLYFLQHFFGWD